MRTFKFKLLTQAQLEEFSTNAVTLGEMKAEIRRNPELLRKFGVNTDSNLDEVQFIERSTKTTYTVNDAILPTTDATMFVSVIKSKAGVELEDMKDFLECIDDETRTELEDFAYELNTENGANIDLDGSKSNLYEAIVDFIEGKIEEAEEAEAAGCGCNFEELVEKGYALLESLTEFIENARNIDDAARTRLQQEAEKIQHHFDKFRYVRS